MLLTFTKFGLRSWVRPNIRPVAPLVSCESQPQNAELADNKSFSDLFSICLKTIDHLNLKLLIFCRHTASFKIQISKVQDLGNFKLSPIFLSLADSFVFEPFLSLAGSLMRLVPTFHVMAHNLVPHGEVT